MVMYYQRDRHIVNLTEKGRNLYFKVHHLFAHIKQQMDQSQFTTVLDPATENCQKRLAWWA